jgi:hypothetical protein
LTPSGSLIRLFHMFIIAEGLSNRKAIRDGLPFHRAYICIMPIMLTLETQNGAILIVIEIIFSEDFQSFLLSELLFLAISGFVANLSAIVTAYARH